MTLYKDVSLSGISLINDQRLEVKGDLGWLASCEPDSLGLENICLFQPHQPSSSLSSPLSFQNSNLGKGFLPIVFISTVHIHYTYIHKKPLPFSKPYFLLILATLDRT